MRSINRRYQDPLEAIWLATAGRLGMKIIRDDAVFASWDGRGTLRIGTTESLDPDDTLAQMIFHEACHALVEGPDAWTLPDWGLDGGGPLGVVHEHACLRLQAAWADRFELRRFLAATTDFRPYYDRLGLDPLDEAEGDSATPRARQAWIRAQSTPWFEPIQQALAATRDMVRMVGPFAPSDSLWAI